MIAILPSFWPVPGLWSAYDATNTMLLMNASKAAYGDIQRKCSTSHWNFIQCDHGTAWSRTGPQLKLTRTRHLLPYYQCRCSPSRQRYTKLTLALGIRYGALVAIIANKSYSTIAYVALAETAHLSSWTTVAVGIAVMFEVVASLTVDPLRAIDVYSVVGGVAMLAVLLWNAARFIRPILVAS